ncbi:MAG: chromosome segregation protein SMC [Chromatiales bacterium]|nr:chromosome segregation protein SMC [Chromatiales bacterium]
MRLKKIKLAGFKSFVDPTTIELTSNLVGIVGPNGCGKSNTIDAVRWVMGETSAKHLRGDSMDDVIFSGSSSRKPVGQAFIELVFDNSDGTLGGEYAQYSEIAVKRQVSRDGQSQYFLNGARCRRRDITDIFLGTGLGPRSYAIIEQGMISRFIEAKPEELRVYIEEAAGISRYKERRRETENRIRHTRENLDRLNDLREEIEKQLNHLHRQARTAERFKELKGEERRAKAELLALRQQSLTGDVEARERELREQETRLEQIVAEIRNLEASLEKDRELHVEANEAFNEVQGRYYKIGGDISRVEQSIQHNREMRFRQERELGQAEQALAQAREHIAQDEGKLEEFAGQIATLEPEHQQAEGGQEQAAAQLAEAEQAMQQWQGEWEDLGRRSAEPSEIAQVERTRMEHLDRQITQYRQRLEKLEQELGTLSDTGVRGEIEGLERQAEEARAAADEQQAQLDEAIEGINVRREQNRELSRELDELRGQLQGARGRLASLEALQQAALGEKTESVTQWLTEQRLADAPRLAEELQAEPGWERAVETVLGDYLEAVCVDDIDTVTGVLGSLESGSLLLFDTRQAGADSAATGDLLATRVRAPWSLTGLLAGVHAVDTLNEALALRPRLGAGESVITRDGIWLGASWLRVSRDADAHAGVLAREQEIRGLQQQLEELTARIEALEEALAAGRDGLREVEARREALQVEVNRLHRAHADLNAQLTSRRGRLEQIEGRRGKVTEEAEELRAQIQQAQEELQQATARRNEAVERMEQLSHEREGLDGRREQLRATLDEARRQAQEHRQRAHEIALKMESLRTAQQGTRQNLERMHEQLGQLEGRCEELREAMQEGGSPVAELEQELEALLGRRMQVEKELNEARAKVQSVEADMRERDQQRMAAERRADDTRSGLERLRMAWQELKVRQQTVVEQLAETEFQLETLLAEMPEGASIGDWQARVQDLEQKIQRLGPINLAAIDEYKEQSQRKEYLDAQHADLIEALETLESAIAKIDRETRQRFRDTFELVNSRLQEMFPKLFGGGHAHLEMTGDDLLTTGVSIMARPPGKRISNIHLMSGGEKALTAVAMVFAIFELNPAPFCMLDEVDAPLDEANVGRFCDLVREMSERVQFIFITHNKTTMELAERLVGVTMREPGVSRLVAVDVEEAAQMATA